MPKINKAFINKLRYDGKEKTYFDSEINGFAVRVFEKSMSYILMYRNEYGQQRKLTIAKTTEITPEEAKKNRRRKITVNQTGTRSCKR